ncbi:MAG: radical SAM protein, partial [Anaerolineae bacterium]
MPEVTPLPADVEVLLQRAWQQRGEHWPAEITASVPVDTLPVSVTGRQCALNCAHCGGHYLEGMRPLDEVQETAATSLLISGGCDRRGRVPVAEHLEALTPLIAGRRTNWHLGLVGGDEVEALQPLLDVVSFDFVGDDETLRQVYGLEVGADEYERCFAMLSRRTRVVPHVTIGLRGGHLGHEMPALERLSAYPLETLVLLVLVPTPGTRYADVEPPPLPEVARLLAEARLRFPATSLQLGCMRPKGEYRQALDQLAVRAGLNVIVNPAREARALATAL